jgi:hypothetical protein
MGRPHPAVKRRGGRLEARKYRLELGQGHAGGLQAGVVVEAAVHEVEQRLGGQRQ